MAVNKDTRGYYRALNVSADASAEEIRLAYEIIRHNYRERRTAVSIGLVTAAYDTLSDPERRRDYDAARSASSRAAARVRGLGAPALIGVLAVALAGVLLLTHAADLRQAMLTFEPGQVLYRREGGGLVGTVVRREREHRFFNGAVANGYLVSLPDGAGEEWYPARDLERLCRR